MILRYKMAMQMRHLLSLILSLLFTNIQAQDSLIAPIIADTSIIQIPSVEILPPQEEPWDNAEASHHVATIYLNTFEHSNLADALRTESGLFVKSYGAGGLATLSFRGGGAAQTALYWEDIPIMNPMLGQTDLSLIPSVFVDEAMIHQTQRGQINLATKSIKASHKDKLWRGNTQLRTGSLGQFEESLTLQYFNKKWTFDTRAFYLTANNNFAYYHPNTRTIERQTNNRQEQYGGLFKTAYQTEKHQLSFQTWLQYNFRQIPPTLLQSSSQDQQTDKSWRNVLQWNMEQQLGKTTWNQGVQMAYSQEQLNFFGSGIVSNSQFRLYFAQLEEAFELPSYYHTCKHRLAFRARSENYQAISNGYPNGVWQNRWSVGLDYHLNWLNGIRLENRVEQLWTNQTQVPINLSSKFKAIIKKHWRVRASVAHNSRIPTLNDLYWQPGGNENLRTENRWDTEIGIDYRSERLPFLLHSPLEFSLTLYSSWIEDWILWQPNTTNGYWTASNVYQVWSRGVEQSLHWSSKSKNWGQIQLSNQYNFTLATQVTPERASTHQKQLIYVPQHKNIAQLTYHYKSLHINYQHEWVSHRFLTTDNLERLPFYHTANLHIAYHLVINDLNPTFFIKINNLLNVDYQIMSQRPLPRRNWELGIKLRL